MQDILEVPPVDLDARVLYFPVRHHSPACSWHLRQLIRSWRPEAVLVEGPRDATPQIEWLCHPKLRAPVAFFLTYVVRQPEGPPQRHGAYYPLCDYSPELVALREGQRMGARLAFIDLTFPEMVRAEALAAGPLGSLQQEHYLRHSRVLRAACQKAGARDPDDLWDQLYEVRHDRVDTATFMREVLTYCALARSDAPQDLLESDGTVAREEAMAWAVSQEKGRTLVVTGGFHSLALATTPPRAPAPLKVAPEDALTVLIRYSFVQLDRLNGYASGLPSPAFYQESWEERDASRLLVRLSRHLRELQGGPDCSTADGLAALTQARQLARFRGHPRLSREDLLDGVRSCFVKGDLEQEGSRVLSEARTLLTGDRVGQVPAEVGQPPLLRYFFDAARRLKLSAEQVTPQILTLDLYRQGLDRERSRFLHQLRFLEVPFASWQKGPDFVKGTGLDRVEEHWKVLWTPGSESRLIELSLRGSTLPEAAGTVLEEHLSQALDQGEGRRSDLATMLLLEACRMGLHQRTADLLERTAALIAEDSLLPSLVRSLEGLLLLGSAREPLEAHHLAGLPELALQAYYRACFLIPELVSLPEESCETELEALKRLVESSRRLEGPSARLAELRQTPLALLAESPEAAPTLRGGATALLYGDGVWGGDRVTQALRGQLMSAQPGRGSAFLQGLLRCGRSLLWQVPELVGTLHEGLRTWPEEQFLEELPNLRLGFSDLTPRECHRVADTVAGLTGQKGRAEELSWVSREFSEADLLRGARLNHRLAQGLARDGLEDWP